MTEYDERSVEKEYEVWFRRNECGQTYFQTFTGDAELFNFAKDFKLTVVLPTEEWVEEKINKFRSEIKKQQKKN